MCVCTHTHIYIHIHTYTYFQCLCLLFSTFIINSPRMGQKSLPLKLPSDRDVTDPEMKTDAFLERKWVSGNLSTLEWQLSGGSGSLQGKISSKGWSLPWRDRLTSCIGRELEARVCHSLGPWRLYTDPFEEEEEAGAFHVLKSFSSIPYFLFLPRRILVWGQWSGPHKDSLHPLSSICSVQGIVLISTF